MAILETFKKHKIICLNPEEKYPFRFGLDKAKLIIANLEAIKAFVESNGECCEPTQVVSNPQPLKVCEHCHHANFHYEYNGKIICSDKTCTICIK